MRFNFTLFVLFCLGSLWGCKKNDDPPPPPDPFPKIYSGTPSRNNYVVSMADLGNLGNYSISCYMSRGGTDKMLPYIDSGGWYHGASISAESVQLYTINNVYSTAEGKIYPPALKDINGIQWDYKIVVNNSKSVMKKYGYPLDRSTINKLIYGESK